MRAELGCHSAIEELESLAASFVGTLARVDLAGVEADSLRHHITTIRAVQREADAAIVRAGLRADELAAAGGGPPAGDALLGSGQVRGSTARREAARAGLAARSDELAKRMGSGEFGPDHLDSLVRRLGRLGDDHLGRLDLASLLGDASRLPADTFDAVLRRAVDAADVPEEGPDETGRARAESEVTHRFDHRTGLGYLNAKLDPERYEAVAKALDEHTASLANSLGEPRNANLAAQALTELICSSGGGRPARAHVTLVVDEATARAGRHLGTIAETGDGHGLTGDAVARLCCDSLLQRVTLDADGVPIDVGRRFRTATEHQWTALRAVYSSCAWAGCDRPLSHCQAHHLGYWQHGGTTDLDNLVPLCSHHHHLVHEGRWHLELLPDRSLRITRPDGQRFATTSPPTRRPPPLDGCP